MSEENLEREAMIAPQDYCPQGSNPPTDASGVSGTSESLNEPISNRSTNKASNNSNETQNCNPRSQIPSTTENLCSETLVRIYHAIGAMINIIKNKYTFTHGLLENFVIMKIDLIQSEEEFALKYVECERVRALTRFIIKTIHRCRKIAKSHLSYILKGLKSYVFKMDLQRIKSITTYMHQNFQLLRLILDLLQLTFKIEAHLNSYSIKLNGAKWEYKSLMQGGKYEKEDLVSPESTQDLVTPIDHDIALTLTALLNSYKRFLLPLLCELQILPEISSSDEFYTCQNTPQSLREHMALLEDILSDSNDLVFFTKAPVDKMNNCFSVMQMLMNNIFTIHENLTFNYLCLTYNVRNINIVTLSVTQEKRNKLISHYYKTKSIFYGLKKDIQEIKSFDRKCLKTFSMHLLLFCDVIDLADIFISMLNLFSWLTTVSAKYAEFIELDEIYLNTFATIISNLKIVE